MPEWARDVLLVLAGALPGLYAIFQQRRKYAAEALKLGAEAENLEADTLAKVAEATAELLDNLREQILDLRTQIRERDVKVTELEQQLGIMSETIQSAIARIRVLEAEAERDKLEKEELHKANLKLLERLERYEEQ